MHRMRGCGIIVYNQVFMFIPGPVKMYDHRNSAVEDSVSPISGTVAHTIMPAVTCYSYSRCNRLQLCTHTLLVTLPVQMDGREMFALKNQINIYSLHETLYLYHAIYLGGKYTSTFPCSKKGQNRNTVEPCLTTTTLI